MLDPDFFLDEEVAKISPLARILYTGLWCLADDHFATIPNSPDWIRAQILPYEKEVKIEDLLKELQRIDKIRPFVSNGKNYYYIKNFHRYQRIDRPSQSKYPEYGLDELKKNTRRVLVTNGRSTHSQVKLSKVKLSKDKYVRIELMFKKFWDAYPKKVAKPVALRSFEKIDPSEDVFEKMLANVTARAQGSDWIKDEGKYIPMPSTYLNQRRWEDEGVVIQSGPKSIKITG